MTQRRNRFYRFGILALLAGLLVAGASSARAELRIDITRGTVEPLPIAVTDFIGANGQADQVGSDISKVITADLERSGLFKALDPKAFIQSAADVNVLPRFGDWRIINAQALINGKAEMVAGGRLRVEFRLWDVFAEQQLVGQAFTTVPNNWRRIAHIVADAIYQRITGETGYFDTQIVYISESGPPNRRVKRLAIMDQDGANHQFLTQGNELVLTPRFSPRLREITFLSYFQNTPRVYIFDLDTGRQEILGDFPGMTFAPRFSPDGKKVIMSMAKDGNSDIFTMDLSTRVVKRLTRHSAIDTSPSYAPDGERVVFNSDRGGTQQIYVMDADGRNVKRISYGDGRYATPVWSPRGDLVAFTKMKGGRFFIGVMGNDGSGERLLTEAFLVEAPTWAPNGRVLMFFREDPSGAEKKGTRSRLYTIDLTGYNEREVVTPLDASDPAWSPLIP